MSVHTVHAKKGNVNMFKLYTIFVLKTWREGWRHRTHYALDLTVLTSHLRSYKSKLYTAILSDILHLTQVCVSDIFTDILHVSDNDVAICAGSVVLTQTNPAIPYVCRTGNITLRCQYDGVEGVLWCGMWMPLSILTLIQ